MNESFCSCASISLYFLMATNLELLHNQVLIGLVSFSYAYFDLNITCKVAIKWWRVLAAVVAH